MKIVLKFILTILSFVILAAAIVTATDYVKAKNDQEPMFCIEKKEFKNSSNDVVDLCKGVLYNYYVVRGEQHIVKRFVPIWVSLDE